MPRGCKICSHRHKASIDQMICENKSIWSIVDIFGGFSRQTLERHIARGHVSRVLKRRFESEELLEADNLLKRLQDYEMPLMKMKNACDEWLRDPADDSAYTLEPRGNEINIVYVRLDPETGRATRRKERLDQIVHWIESEQPGLKVLEMQYRHSDPRNLVLQTAREAAKFIELLGRLTGELVERVQINFETDPKWTELKTAILSALQAHPVALMSVSDRIAEVLGNENDN